MAIETASPARPVLAMTPARRVALAIGVPVCLVAVVSTGFSLVANIGRGSLTESYALPATTGQVKVSLGGGDVLLRQVAGRGSLTGRGYYSLVRPHVSEHFASGTATIEYKCAVVFGDCGLNATVNVPAGAAASVSTDGGDIRADGFTRPVSLSTGGGNVTVDRVMGDLTVNTDGGDITAEGVTAAQVNAGTGGGNIEVVFTRVPRDVRVNTDGGDITIVVPAGGTLYRVTAHTDGGTTTESVPTSTNSPNVITATSGGGNITIRQAG